VSSLVLKRWWYTLHFIILETQILFWFIQLWFSSLSHCCWCWKWRIPVVVDVMPLKLSLFSMSFFAMKWAAILVCLGFQSWFSGSVYILYLALLNSCRHWLVNERPSTLNFSHLIVRTHPPRLGRSWAFFSSFYSSVKRSCRLSTKFALSQKCVRGGPKAVRRRVGSPVMGTWRENSNLSQKIGGSVSCHSLVNAGIENSPDEVDGGRCTKTGVGLGRVNKWGVERGE